MRIFDTNVQQLKYEVLREVARHAYADNLTDCYIDIPKQLAPGPKATMRCCIYKERAILQERIKLAMGGHEDKPNVIEVIPIACDECPISRYAVGVDCRGCNAHRCQAACPAGAISFDENQKARIDPTKCKECGKCAAVCPYSAISRHVRPCEKACKIKAISRGEDNVAHINDDKCISCGACVYQCPFGAIMDKSYILNVIDMLQKAQKQGTRVYAVVAPSVSSQFTYAKLGQVITGIKQLGFYAVVEAALGADMVAYEECKELYDKKFLTSSCCPAFVSFIEKNFPQLKDKISHNLSPAATISKYIKEHHENVKVVFIGPCTAKKMEYQKESVRPYIDSVITFEELQALFDGKEIDITSLPETALDNASYYGRIFARCGGLGEAVAEGLKERGLTDFECKSVSCDGIEECRIALLKASKGVLDANFIEGMACVGGCIGGAGCLTHGEKSKAEVDKYGKEAMEKTILDAVSLVGIRKE